MTDYDTHLDQKMNVKYEDLTDKITEVDEWNRLSLHEFDKIFAEDTHKVINDQSLLHIEDVKPSSYLGNNYLYTKIGLPRGESGDLHRAMVKRRKLDNEFHSMVIDNNIPILYMQLYKI